MVDSLVCSRISYIRSATSFLATLLVLLEEAEVEVQGSAHHYLEQALDAAQPNLS